jgi:Amidohydrolase family
MVATQQSIWLPSGISPARPNLLASRCHLRRHWGMKLLTAFGFCASLAFSLAAAADCSVFVDVTVVATEHKGLQPHQTLTVRDGRIADIHRSSDVAPPADCLAIDGNGRYLIPGLIDTHVHFFGYSRAGEGDRLTEAAVLKMLLANGVTTALIMEGTPEILRLRAELAAGRLTGPRLFSAGPLIQAADTAAPPHRLTFTTPDEVIREVEAEKKLGYDFVKVHGAMPVETYAALLKTAHRMGLPVIGHVPDNLGIDAALNGGQRMIAHAESYLQTYFEFNRKLPTDRGEIDAMVRDIARRTAVAHIYVQPTLSVFRQIIAQVADPDALLQRPEMKLLPPDTLSDWMPDRNPYLKNWTYKDIARFRAQYAVMQKLVRGLRDAGVPLLVGTDDMVPMQLPGLSMRDEMLQLEEAGLTPFEVLQAATFTSAQFLEHSSSVGAIKPGYVADLVLLEANPLEDVGNIFRQGGVMLQGHWFTEADLQRALWAPEVTL